MTENADELGDVVEQAVADLDPDQEKTVFDPRDYAPATVLRKLWGALQEHVPDRLRVQEDRLEELDEGGPVVVTVDRLDELLSRSVSFELPMKRGATKYAPERRYAAVLVKHPDRYCRTYQAPADPEECLRDDSTSAAEPSTEPSEQVPWKALTTKAVEAMASRGIRLNPDRWQGNVENYRRHITQLSSTDPKKAGDLLESLDSYADAVLQDALSDPDHRVRATWETQGTWSGRITASAPPLQEIAGCLRGAFCGSQRAGLRMPRCAPRWLQGGSHTPSSAPRSPRTARTPEASARP
ncbi:MAG: hypothetical protein JRI25_15320 [Deltaproteobacteria bacterium]|nr:hypothetical protein [Deltaproteobacteria bacterium]